MKFSREQIAIACFICATYTSSFVNERTWTRILLHAFLGLGLMIYCQSPKHPGLTRLLRTLSGATVVYIAGVFVFMLLEWTNTFRL